MKIGIITLFPEMFALLQHGLIKRALDNQAIELFFWNPRDFTQDRHRRVDDRPYGGGPGMVMEIGPLKAAIDSAKSKLGEDTSVIYLSPQGQVLTQAKLVASSKKEAFIFLAGRYEGVDERLIDLAVDEEWSLGDYVLSGGELPACVIIEAFSRLLPGVLNNKNSIEEDSFSSEGLLDHPHYTRPEEFQGLRVPEILRSGDHKAIKSWRFKKRLERTQSRRPDLWTVYLKKGGHHEKSTYCLH